MPRTQIHPVDDPSPSPTPSPTSLPMSVPLPRPIPAPPISQTQPNQGLVGSFDKTDLDIEDPNPNGGIPYKQDKDPTVYPPTTQAQTPERGYFATPGKAASKFEQKYSPTNTYLDSIKDYI
jgi:hypothetical protein